MICAEGIGVFGDVRRAERGAWLFERIVATGSLVSRTVDGNRAGEIAAHRFLDSPRVSAAEMIGTLGRRTGERCRGRRIIAVQDTTEINFSGRDRARTGLGPAGDGKTPGVNGGGKLGQMPAPKSAISAPRFQTVGVV